MQDGDPPSPGQGWMNRVDEPVLEAAEEGPFLPPGVYECKSCVDEYGSSPEFPVMGRMNPADVCACHPDNGMEDFRFMKVLEIDPRMTITVDRVAALQDAVEQRLDGDLGVTLFSPGVDDSLPQ